MDHRTRNEDGYSLSKLARPIVEDVSAAWAIRGLLGYCTTASVADAIEKACTVPLSGHEVLWVVESETFASAPSRALAKHFYPQVPIIAPFDGRASFFDIERTRRVLGWAPSTEGRKVEGLVDI